MPLLYLAFAFSGAAALIYEITWTRLLTLFMGHTVAAASTVLAAFMGGLALGAALAGRVAPRLDRGSALRGYAVIELLIAVAAIALPFEMAASRPLLAAAYANGDGGVGFGLVRVASALAAVTVPAIAMGATLPLVVRWAVSDARRAGGDTGLLYAANTVGAATGAVLSGFVLLPALGLRLTTGVGVVLNVVSAGLAWRLSYRTSQISNPKSQPSIPRPKSQTAVPKPRHQTRSTATAAAMVPVFVPAAALAISGGVSLIQQIAWTRILALVIGPTTFAFSAVVATFIAGIALGSLLGGRIARRGPIVWPLAATLLIAALAAAGAATYAPRVPLVVAEAVAEPDAGFAAVVRLQSAVIAALMMPMTVAFGAAFPLAVGLAAREDLSVPRDVASVYAANTIGAIVGALTGGFWLVPRFGLEDTVRLAAAIAVAGFALVMLAAHRGTRTTLATGAIASAAIVMIWLLPPWDRELLSSGAYKYAPYLSVEHREAMLRAGTLLYYREGAAGTVSVRRLTGWISLAIDGKVDASNAGDMLTQKLLAHVPLLLHRSPRRVAVIGLGSGVTAGAALRHPIETVDTLEISPEVVEASNFFRRENHDALQDRRSRLIVGDGRSHLLLGDATYDVIISEPSNPWMAGVASLFTREFFEAARRRLAPDGILCQWAHTYDISDEDLRSIVSTFTSVFPDAALWLVGEGDILLTGSPSPIASRLEAMREGWTRPGVADDLREVEVREVESLLSLYTADGSALGAYAGDAVIQTDDRMALEFSAPRSIYGRTTTNNAATLRALADHHVLPDAVRLARSAPQVMVNRGRMELRAEAFPAAFANFARALESRPDDQAAIDGLLEAAAPTRRMAEAEQLIRGTASSRPRNVPAIVALSRMMAARGDFEAAAGVLRPVFDPPAPDLRVLEQLASVFADAGDQDRLAAVVEDMRRVAPDADATLYYTASHLFLTGRHDQAVAAAERLRARNPRHARCQNLLGAAYASLGRGDRARRAFEASIEADPRDPTTYSNLAMFELQSGNPAAAVDRFAEALTLDPSSAGAREGLAQAVAALGQ